MKIFRRSLSVFLAVLMLVSSLYVSLVAFAADVQTDALYKNLAYSFLENGSASGGSYELKTDANGYPIKSLVADLNQYTVSNESNDYRYADDVGVPIRNIAYTHKVTAKDDSIGTIRSSVGTYLQIVDAIISYTYGVGNYTIPMIIKEVQKQLKFIKGDDGEYLFLDGYTYLVDSYGNIFGRSPEKTYYVSNGEIKFYPESEDKSWEKPFVEKVKAKTFSELNLFDYCNIPEIIDYFSGNCTSVNSGNWFHTFIFECNTDLETVLIHEGLANGATFSERHFAVTWGMERQHDESGLRAQYYNKGYEVTLNTSSLNNSRRELLNLKSSVGNLFDTYYAPGFLENATNDDIIKSYYTDVRRHYPAFSALSNDAKLAVFGEDAYSYMNLVTQLTPITDTKNLDKYLPSHTYENYQDSSGNNIVYKITTDKVTSVVNTIDALLKSERVGTIIKTFVDFSDPKYEGKAFYGVTANTAQEVLVQVVQNYVFDDSIINMIIGFLYPTVSNLLDDNLKDSLLNGLDSTLKSIVNWIIGNGGIQYLVYESIAKIGVFLTPSGLACAWNRYGYLDPNKNSGWSEIYKKNHDILNAAKGADKNSNGYYYIGKEGDSYCGNRWRDLDVDKLVWNINGDRSRFQSVLSGILLPLVPLLAILLGNVKSDIPISTKLGTMHLIIENLTLYNDTVLPLLEALNIPKLTSASDFEKAADATRSDSNRNPTTVKAFLDTIIDPVLNWVVDDILNDPISIVAGLLPNISQYFTTGAFISSVKDIVVDIRLSPWIPGTGFSVYTLEVADLLKDKLDFLYSLQGIIDLVGFKVDTGVPVVGYYADGSSMVYRPGMAGYDERTTNIPVSEAYISATGNMNLYQNDEFTTRVTGIDDEGNYTNYIILDDVGWRNAAGDVVTARNDTTATPQEYNTAVKEYYEYSRTDADTGESITYRTTYLPNDIKDSGEYKYVRNIRTMKENANLPAIMDYKLQACGTRETTTSGRYKAFTMTDANGASRTWQAGQREYINMHVAGHKSEGLVLIFLLRYIFSALEYRVYDKEKGDFTSDYTLIDAFKLRDTLNKELFQGLKLNDIIGNIALDPDATISALFELFYKNEDGSLYTIEETADGVRNIVQGKPFKYGLDYVDYHTADIMSNAKAHNDYNFGTTVIYTEYWSKEDSQYVIDNIDNIVNDVLTMLKLDPDSQSLGNLLNGLLKKYLFNNDMLSKIVGMIYGMIDGIDAVDLPTILKAALDVDYSKRSLYNALMYEFDNVNTEVTDQLYSDFSADIVRDKYDDNCFYKMGVDEETGETAKLGALDWGFENDAITAKYSDSQIFLKAVSAALSPFAILFKYLFLGDDLSILGLINIPGYEGYQYALIPLFEALTATRGLVSYRTYFEKVFNNADSNDMAGNCDAIYLALVPLFNFIDDLVQNPVEVLLTALPNLLFVITVGGLSDIVNNFVHFVYVLVDIIQPIFDVYPFVNSLLSNLRIGDFAINLSLPLDIDINQIVNELIDGVVGSMLNFDIENKKLVVDTKQVEKEVTEPVLDENGEEQYDENGDVIVRTVTETVTENVYAVGTLKITIPNIDLTTLCAGFVQEKTSISGYRIVFLNSSGGADLLTVVLRLITDILFYKDNALNIADFLVGYCQLDDEDNNDDLLIEIFSFLNDQAHANDIPDKTLHLIFTVYKVLVPIADNLGARFAKVDFSIKDMFGDMSNIQTYIQALIDAGTPSDSNIGQTLSGFAKLIAKLKAFFEMIASFFKGLFGK